MSGRMIRIVAAFVAWEIGCGGGGSAPDADGAEGIGPDVATETGETEADVPVAEGDGALDSGEVPSGELCDNGVDDDGDGLVDCEESACWSDPSCTEVCGSGRDEDLDGLADCEDEDSCGDAPGCRETHCGDSADDDGDTLADCRDWDCIGSPDCAGGPGGLGDPCADHADCASGACLGETALGWPGGYCTVWGCVPDPTGGCPGGVCTALWAGVDSTVCVRNCTGDGSVCRPGYRCLLVGEEIEGCVGDCTDAAQCTTTHRCRPGDGGFAPGLCVALRETCDDGIDDDGDTATDCLDDDCRFAGTCAGTVALGGGSTCGDGPAIPMPDGERGIVVVTASLAADRGDDHTPACQERDSVDVHYVFRLGGPARVTIDLLGAAEPPGLGDTVLSLARACGEPDLRCSDDVRLGSPGVPEWEHSRIEGVFGAGTYHVFVDGYDGALGDFTLGFELADPGIPADST